ncbi:MAG: hypothetical protein ACRDZ5_01500 [Acidimicrobiales bacterium]
MAAPGGGGGRIRARPPSAWARKRAVPLSAWARKRAVPLSVSVGFVVVSMQLSLWWYDFYSHSPGIWRMPGDFWATFSSSVELVHGHFSGVYSHATGLVTLPGVTFLLAPVAGITSGLGWHLGPPAGGFFSPTSWLLAGPVMLALSTVPLFAIDRIAQRFGLSLGRRVGLALAEAVVLANVALLWGHLEDAVSVGLVLYAVVAAQDRSWPRAASLLGLAIAVQPLAVLAVPAVLAPLGLVGSLRQAWRLVLPAVIVVILPLVAEPGAVWHALFLQPNYPSFNHPTPWTSMAPRLSNGGVGAGPTRALATLGALAGGAAFCRRRPGAERVLLVIGGAFGLRVLLEVVVADFYVWPALAICLVVAARRGTFRLGLVAVVAAGESFLQQQHFGGIWPWWILTVGLLGLCFVLVLPARRSEARAGAPAPAPAPELALSAPGSSEPL